MDIKLKNGNDIKIINSKKSIRSKIKYIILEDKNMKDKISELLYNELDYIYCDNCKFYSMWEDESIEKYGYYGCEDCCRKCMGWEISKKFSDKLAEKILNIIKEQV